MSSLFSRILNERKKTNWFLKWMKMEILFSRTSNNVIFWGETSTKWHFISTLFFSSSFDSFRFLVHHTQVNHNRLDTHTIDLDWCLKHLFVQIRVTIITKRKFPTKDRSVLFCFVFRLMVNERPPTKKNKTRCNDRSGWLCGKGGYYNVVFFSRSDPIRSNKQTNRKKD